jgi:hypothetical protein
VLLQKLLLKNVKNVLFNAYFLDVMMRKSLIHEKFSLNFLFLINQLKSLILVLCLQIHLAYSLVFLNVILIYNFSMIFDGNLKNFMQIFERY